MILIALSWFVLLLFFILAGIAVKSILNFKSTNNYLIVFLGIFAQCLALNIFAIFFRIGIEVFVANTTISLVIFIWKYKEIKSIIWEIKNDIQNLSITSKCFLLLIFVLSLYKCSQYSYIVDNESYYIQTIKWINEYGFVKGLGNLHIFLGQTSPFHVLQAGFNFNFITQRSNDINGLIFNLSSLFFISEFEKNNTSNKKTHWLGFVFTFSILFFQFLNAPSPDLIIILISQIIFYYFLEKENNFENFKVISILFLLLFFIKITVAPFGLIILFLMGFKKKRVYFFATTSLIILSVLVVKNIVLTGYPFFPFSFFPTNYDWKIPENLLNFMNLVTQNAGYYNTAIGEVSLNEQLYSWIRLGGINRFFNIGILILFIAFGVVKALKIRGKYLIIYSIFAIHFILLLLFSPQYRFFLPEFIFMASVLIWQFFGYLNTSQKTVQLFLLLFFVSSFFATEVLTSPQFMHNEIHHQNDKISWKELLVPKKKSKYSEIEFQKIKEGNLIYNSPKDSLFFYGTANGKLPCTNKLQLNYLKTYYLIQPQLRTKYLKDGFYSKKVSTNE